MKSLVAKISKVGTNISVTAKSCFNVEPSFEQTGKFADADGLFRFR